MASTSYIWENEHLLMSHSQESLERLPEFWVEDGVDEGVDAAVDVAQPRGQDEGSVPGPPVQLKLDADGVDHIAREERDPAHKKASWNRKAKAIDFFALAVLVHLIAIPTPVCYAPG